MLPHKSLRRADIVASSAMIGLGVVVIYAGSRMPWASTLTGGDAQWYLSPGLFPTIIGSLLVLFSLRILFTAINEGGTNGLWTATRSWFCGLPRNRRIHRAIIITVLMAIYIFVGLGRVPYLIASGLFLFVSIAIFWWRDAGNNLLRYIAVTTAISAGVPFAISYLFTKFLFVPMP